jgi:hypothetical protein
MGENTLAKMKYAGTADASDCLDAYHSRVEGSSVRVDVTYSSKGDGADTLAELSIDMFPFFRIEYGDMWCLVSSGSATGSFPSHVLTIPHTSQLFRA